MKTEITYTYNNRQHCTIVNCLNPSNAPAMLFLKHPNLDQSRVKIINAVGIVPPGTQFHSQDNHQNKS